MLQPSSTSLTPRQVHTLAERLFFNEIYTALTDCATLTVVANRVVSTADVSEAVEELTTQGAGKMLREFEECNSKQSTAPSQTGPATTVVSLSPHLLSNGMLVSCLAVARTADIRKRTLLAETVLGFVNQLSTDYLLPYLSDMIPLLLTLFESNSRILRLLISAIITRIIPHALSIPIFILPPLFSSPIIDIQNSVESE